MNDYYAIINNETVKGPLTEDELDSVRSQHASDHVTVTETVAEHEPALSDDSALLQFDGASKGNPGPGSLGYVIHPADDSDPVTVSAYIGDEVTNNVAEYKALISGLYRAKSLNITELHVKGDSKLIVNQVTETWDCNAERLQPLCDEAQSLVNHFDSFTIEHVPREQNSTADNLANDAIPDTA